MTVKLLKPKTNRKYTGLRTDTKPTLGIDDVGDEFYETDTNMLSTWFGSGWGSPLSENYPRNVPLEYTRVTANSAYKIISKGQLNKIEVYPRIGNEHVESSREAQAVVTSSNIVGQVFRASKDNITALVLTLESAAGVPLDNFESYGTSTDLQALWVHTGNAATLEETIVSTGVKAMSLPTTTNGDEWIRTIPATDYTGYTGNFDAYFDATYSKQKLSIFIGDGTNTKSFQLQQSLAGVWTKFHVLEAAMTDDGVTSPDITQITQIGFRVAEKSLGNTVKIDNLEATPQPGSIDIKLRNMGSTMPVSGTTTLAAGVLYPSIGDAATNSYTLELSGGKRLYHMDEFKAGYEKSIPSNELLVIGNYYILELVYNDTEVTVYGPDTSLGIQYYQSGYAFTAPNTSTAITALGTYSNIMFGIMSMQDIYIIHAGWRFIGTPATQATLSVFLENTDMQMTDAIIDHKHAPEVVKSENLSIRPLFLEDGGKLEYYYNDDYTDSVTNMIVDMHFLYVTPTAYL